MKLISFVAEKITVLTKPARRQLPKKQKTTHHKRLLQQKDLSQSQSVSILKKYQSSSHYSKTMTGSYLQKDYYKRMGPIRAFHMSPKPQDFFTGLASDPLMITTLITQIGGVGGGVLTGTALSWITFKLKNSSQSHKDYATRLLDLEKLVQEKWIEINKVITKLDVENTIPRLQLHSKVYEKEIQIFEEFISLIKEQLGHYQRFLDKSESLKKDLEDKGYLKQAFFADLKRGVINLIADLNLQNQQLKLAKIYCETMLYRKQKRFEPALIAVDQWIAELNIYHEMLQQNHYSQSVASTENMLVTAYNVKAKIHRALAGTDMQKLDLKQLTLSKESYEHALRFKDDIAVRSSLGFLLDDTSTMIISLKERETMLSQALEYHRQAKAKDSQNSDINHGLGYGLYKLEEYHHEIRLKINDQNLQEALDAYSIVERKNPNARLYHDRGLIYLLQGEEDKALEDFNMGLKLEPHHVLLRYERGKLLLKQGKLIEALEDFQEGRMLSVDSISLKNKYDQAIQAAKSQLSLDNSSATKPVTFTTNVSGIKSSFFTQPVGVNSTSSVPVDEDELDIRKIAKQAEFEKVLRECVDYVKKKNANAKQITIFISYAWGNSRHEKQVEQLAKELEMAGFDVLLDRWEDRKGKDLMSFVNKIVESADYVITVGTPAYLEKYNKRVQVLDKREPVVGIEARLLDYMIGYSRNRSERIIPIVLEGPVEKSLPPLMLPKLFANFEHGDKYAEMFGLIRDIYQIDNRDKEFEAIKLRFLSIAEEIDQQVPKELAEQYEKEMRRKLAEQKLSIQNTAQEAIRKASTSISPKP